MADPTIWDIIKALPEATHSVVNEYLMDPTSQRPLGGQQNAQDYLKSLLENEGGEGIAEALIKGGLEGAINTFVPRTALDVTQEGALTAAGGALKGAQGLKAAEEAAQAAKGARGAARVGRLNRGLRQTQGPKNLANKPGVGTGTAQKGYFGGGAKGAAARADKTWQAAAGGRPSPGQMADFERSRAALPKPGGTPGPSSFLEEQARAPRLDSAAEAATMDKRIAYAPSFPGRGAAIADPINQPNASWVQQLMDKGLSAEEILKAIQQYGAQGLRP